MSEQTDGSEVTISRGSILLPISLYEKYLPTADLVALLNHENGVLIVPLIQGAAGGILVKMRNIKGDRVIQAEEFFRNHGLNERLEQERFPVRWISDRAGLLIEGLVK